MVYLDYSHYNVCQKLCCQHVQSVKLLSSILLLAKLCNYLNIDDLISNDCTFWHSEIDPYAQSSYIMSLVYPQLTITLKSAYYASLLYGLNNLGLFVAVTPPIGLNDNSELGGELGGEIFDLTSKC